LEGRVRLVSESFIKSIPCIHVPVSNLLRSVNWWIENFNVEYGSAFDPTSGKAELRVGNGEWIFLFETNKIQKVNIYSKGDLPHSDNSQIYLATLNVKEPELLYRRLLQNGVNVGELREAWTGKAFDCYDPDGNKFNLWGGEWIED
jgi:uncharacterized glyoxalase superfamily protein PhnB